jgi:hypothetical protein
MTDNKILDGLLLSLADLFESQINNRVVIFEHSTPAEFEPVREYKARLIAEGSAVNFQGTGGLRFTSAGYAKYSYCSTRASALGRPQRNISV